MQEKDFIAYEYKTVLVKAADQSKAMDMYEAFGWEITSATPSALSGVMLSLKRDRKIKHKQELNKLERQAGDIVKNIDALKRSKTFAANIFAYTFGICSALVLGGGMSLVMLVENSVPALIGGIALGILGIALCCINYPVYKKIVEKKTGGALPVIDDNEEKLAIVLEKANGLLSADII